MTKQATFSRQIKDELVGVQLIESCCRRAEICAAFFSGGHFYSDSVTLTTAHAGWAARLTEMIVQQYQINVNWSIGHDMLSLTISDQNERPKHDGSLYVLLLHDLRTMFGNDLFNGSGRPAIRLHECCRQAILRALFLTCGSLSKPSKAYHLELAIRNPAATRMAVMLLNHFEIKPGVLQRHHYDVIYLNEGQHIADFLLYTGAHHSLLNFESLRVEKEIRNSVNRAVNCDSANTQRIADTAVRQLELIRDLAEHYGLGVLPSGLKAAAEARLANPDLSLKELGEMMKPPLGKSGINHRLKRLEVFAADMLNKSTDKSALQGTHEHES